MIPDHTRDTIIRYVDCGIPPGSFVRAVLENDLKDAFRYADDTNLANMKDIVSYVYWEIPSICWGSSEIVENWLNKFSEQNEEVES